jgi:hypothetical protein
MVYRNTHFEWCKCGGADKMKKKQEYIPQDSLPAGGESN